MNEKTKRKFEDFIKYYEVSDEETFFHIFEICMELQCDESLINLSEMSDSDLRRIEDIIEMKWHSSCADFIRRELEARYHEEEYLRKSPEWLYA
jgi:hypothetical protein